MLTGDGRSAVRGALVIPVGHAATAADRSDHTATHGDGDRFG